MAKARWQLQLQTGFDGHYWAGPSRKEAPPTLQVEPEAEAETLPPPVATPSEPAKKGSQKRRKECFALEDSFDGDYWNQLTPRRSGSRVARNAQEDLEVTVPRDATQGTDGARNGDPVEEEEAVAEFTTPVRLHRMQDAESESKLANALEEQGEAAAKEMFLKNSYYGSAAERLRQPPRELGEVIPDVATGQISMDGVYWSLEGSSRSRQKRELQFFPDSHVVGGNGTSVPRAPLSPESKARQRAAQRLAYEQMRVEREAENRRKAEEFAELVQFLSCGRVVIPGLYISGRLAAENDAWLDETIDFVVNLSGMRFPYEARFNGRNQLLALELADDPHADAKSMFVRVVEIVDERMKNGERVLIHCKQGKSRSATFVAAYLIARRQMTLQSALALLTRINRGHRINNGFLTQLMEWECACLGLERSSIFEDFFSRTKT